MKKIPETVEGLAQLINDPVLIVLMLVIGALVGISYLLLRALDKKDKQVVSLMSELNENSKTLAKLVILIEVMVHGKK